MVWALLGWLVGGLIGGIAGVLIANRFILRR